MVKMVLKDHKDHKDHKDLLVMMVLMDRMGQMGHRVQTEWMAKMEVMDLIVLQIPIPFHQA